MFVGASQFVCIEHYCGDEFALSNCQSFMSPFTI